MRAADEAQDMSALKCQTVLVGALSPELAYEMSKAIKKSVTDTYGTKLLPYMHREIKERLGEVSRDNETQKSAGLELIDIAAEETR